MSSWRLKRSNSSSTSDSWGHKRFSLEGGETLIPAMSALLTKAAELGVREAVLGMAHRGRINVLAHILKKPLERIFSEFEGHVDPQVDQSSGDVKYHPRCPWQVRHAGRPGGRALPRLQPEPISRP